jgi:hypothetical protein
MSGSGQNAKYSVRAVFSALPPNSDIARRSGAVRRITQRGGASHDHMRLTNGNALRLAPMPAILISRGNDAAQMSWGRRDRDYLSWATDRSLTHATICAFEPWAATV